MLKFISRLLRFSGRDAWKLKVSALISFIEGILSNYPIYAAFIVIIKISDGTLATHDILMTFLSIFFSLALRWILRRVFLGLQSDAAVRIAARERTRIGGLYKNLWTRRQNASGWKF
jgi:hypothetical protein